MSYVLQHENITIFHNGDYSGDVEIVVYDLEEWRAFQAADGRAAKGHPRAKVLVPFVVLQALVGNWVRDARIAALEQAEATEILLRSPL